MIQHLEKKKRSPEIRYRNQIGPEVSWKFTNPIEPFWRVNKGSIRDNNEVCDLLRRTMNDAMKDKTTEEPLSGELHLPLHNIIRAYLAKLESILSSLPLSKTQRKQFGFGPTDTSSPVLMIKASWLWWIDEASSQSVVHARRFFDFMVTQKKKIRILSTPENTWWQSISLFKTWF